MNYETLVMIFLQSNIMATCREEFINLWKYIHLSNEFGKMWEVEEIRQKWDGV